MKNAIILMGLPLAGKSDWINNLPKKYKDYYIVSADVYKEQHPEYDPDNAFELHNWSVKEAEIAMNTLSDVGQVDIIMDGGGINNRYTKRIINRLKKNDYHIKLVHIKTPLEVCIERNKKRTRKVPAWAIQEKSITENKHFHKL